MEQFTPEESIRNIGRAFEAAVKEICPGNADVGAALFGSLEDAASLLVLELQRYGFTVVPKRDYDDLVISARRAQ